ncbi:hypothetical protein BgiMline_025455 [Biomphalaria glabrata]|nr:muscarinic acetylcholine receptor M3-like [Biomphalaria glabrata]
MALSGNTTSNSDVNSYYLSRALWPAVAYTVLMMTVGTVGNILVLVVYRRQYRKSVTRLFIFALAALDIGNCLITMPAELVILIHFTSFPSATWCKATRYLTYIFNGSSSIILIAISMDRYFKVCRPTHQGMDIGRARLVCYGSFLLAALLSIPALIIYGDMVLPVLITGEEVSLLPFDTPMKNRSMHRVNSEGITETTITGTFCLLTTDYMDSLLPTFFYIGMLVLYLILIFFVIFFYSQVAKTMFVLTRKHSQMFTFYTTRELSSPNSAVLDDRPVSHSCGASNIVIREVSTFDEDGPYDQCGQLDPVSTVGSSHLCDQEDISRQGRSQSQRTALGTKLRNMTNSFRFNDNKNASVRSHQLNHDDGKTHLRNIFNVESNAADATLSIQNNSSAVRRDKTQSDIISVPNDVNSNSQIGSKKFRKSHKIPKIKVHDACDSNDRLNYTSSMHSIDLKSLNVSNNSLLLRRIKSAENINSLTRLNKLHMPERASTKKITAPIFPDAYEDLLPKVSSRKSRKEKTTEVGHVTKSCVNLDYVGGCDDDNDSHMRANSEKTLTLTKKTSPQGKKKICVIPLTGLSTKTALLAQDSQGEFNTTKGSNPAINGKKDTLSSLKPSNPEKVPSVDHLDVTLRPKSPEIAAPGGSSRASSNSRKSQEGAKNSRSPRQEIVSTADILQEHHNRCSLHPFRTSRMLFTISLVFVISFLPFFIIALIRSSMGSSFLVSLTNAQLGVVSIFIRSSLISNAVNPIIYGLLSSHFRRECTGLVCCLWR